MLQTHLKEVLGINSDPLVFSIMVLVVHQVIQRILYTYFFCAIILSLHVLMCARCLVFVCEATQPSPGILDSGISEHLCYASEFRCEINKDGPWHTYVLHRAEAWSSHTLKVWGSKIVLYPPLHHLE